MKKILLGTTALVAMTAVSAGVAKAEMSITGWSYVAFGTSLDGDKNTNQHDGLVSYNNSELNISGSSELDNGMTASMNVNINASAGEGRTSTSTTSGGPAGANEMIDETTFTLSDSWGSLQFGSDDGASDQMHVGGAWVSGGMGVGSGLYSLYATNAVYGGAFMATSGSLLSDSVGISYFSPNMNGLQLGVTYVPMANGGGGNNYAQISYASNTTAGNVLSFGASFNTDMDGVALAVSGGLETVQNPNNVGGDDSYELYRAGADVGVGGFGLNLSYSTRDYQTTTIAQSDEVTYGVAASYSMGEHTFGLSGMYGERDTTQSTAGDGIEATIVALDYSMSIGSGVYWDVHLADLDYDTAGSTDTDANATILQTGVGVSF